MFRMRTTAVIFVCLVISASAGVLAQSMASRDLGVDIEVFSPWGFLGLGNWEPLDVSFVSMQIARPDSSDTDHLAELRTLCSSDATLDQEACSVLSAFDYVFHRQYAATPVLGAQYRVVLTNRTSALLGVVLEIDGLNTNGGLAVTGTAQDKKWVLLPNQTVRIAGWQVTSSEALAFRFATPSHTLSPLDDQTGTIRVYVYLYDPIEAVSRGTEAGELIDQPTVQIPFRSATTYPADVLALSYARESVSLGILCEETDGLGIRISEVVSGTIAELRGLQAGDIITSINAVPVDSCADLQDYLRTRQPGDHVVLKVHREGRTFLLALEIEE
jgi:hypothetical protein